MQRDTTAGIFVATIVMLSYATIFDTSDKYDASATAAVLLPLSL